MQRLIIITGDLAAGKSTLASALSEVLGIPYIIKDTLKEIACDIIGYQTRQENRQLSITATQDMIYFFKQCALVGNDLILEANFRTDELTEIKRIAEEYNYNAVLLVLTGDIYHNYESIFHPPCKNTSLLGHLVLYHLDHKHIPHPVHRHSPCNRVGHSLRQKIFLGDRSI